MNHSSNYRPEDFQKLRHLIEEITESRCKNATSTIIQELRFLLKAENVTDVTDQQKSEDGLAVLYIVFVLFFFAASLLVLLLKYLRRERESSRLQKFYEDYLDTKYPSRWVCYDKTGRRLETQVSRESSGATPDSPRPTSTNTPLTTPPTTPPPTPIHASVLLEHVF
ncbi:uncharacterized protein [Panulirus ornatus]|uniref:uncharacterized protein n=1 Tax=Panulirus ornatus TaxID=150431 RepID=UPI003A88B9AC